MFRVWAKTAAGGETAPAMKVPALSTAGIFELMVAKPMPG
jgi:hypothetical protein